jgi:hypothetical protein
MNQNREGPKLGPYEEERAALARRRLVTIGVFKDVALADGGPGLQVLRHPRGLELAWAYGRVASAFDLDGAYALDDDWRVGRRYARREDAEQALAYMAGREEYLPVAEELTEELKQLGAYWGAGVTKEDAARAYHDAAASGHKEGAQ